MRKAREILRLKHVVWLANRQIGSILKMSHVTVGTYLKMAEEAKIGWPLPADVSDPQLMALLRASGKPPTEARRPLPDMDWVSREMRKKHVTLQLLWEEYRRNHPDGYRYTQFCEYYKRYACRLEPCLRQEYKAGDVMFVDWAGDTIPLWDAPSGGSRPAYLFVAVLGASNYTFARAFEDKQMASWVEAHIQAWEFFGGVARLTVPDNEKTAVTQANRYEGEINRTYEELTGHYGTGALPARPYSPQDKAKVESGVLNAERRILAVLRDQRFLSLGEMNAGIDRALSDLNHRPFQKMAGSRRSLFEEVERPALRALPPTRFELATWQKAKVNIDYHIQVDWHFYSVPYRLVQEPVEVRLTRRTVEIFHQGQRVALHRRSFQRGKSTTDPMHRPPEHQGYLGWSPERLIGWVGSVIGPYGGQLMGQILKDQPYPERGYRSGLGLIRLSGQYGSERAEKACRRALKSHACSYRSVKSILETGLDREPLTSPAETPVAMSHENVRGSDYYRNEAIANEVNHVE